MAAEIGGTEDNDVLIGTALADDVNGLGGDDLLRGRAGGDVLEGGPGDDVIVGDRGRDFLDSAAFGQPSEVPDGVDMMRGGYGPDLLFARDGDRAFGGGQDDVLRNFENKGGGVVLRGGYGDDKLISRACESDCDYDALSSLSTAPAMSYGGAGADHFELYDPSGISRGGPGDDYMSSTDSNVLFGGSGNDRIVLPRTDFEPAGAANRIEGGRGDDEIDTSLGTVRDAVSCGAGHDLILIGRHQQGWPSDCEVRYIHLWGTITCSSDCDGNDYIVGTKDDDWIDALWDDDTVESLGGDDRVFLGYGSDSARTGRGDDFVDATVPSEDRQEKGSSDDVRCGRGFDTLIANRNDTYASNCESVTIK